LQVALGAPILVKTKEMNPLNIAKEEFKQKIIPITVKRTLPSGEEITIEIKKAIENYIAEHRDEF
jgi:DNA-directed RNA polymerase subunit K/omega